MAAHRLGKWISASAGLALSASFAPLAMAQVVVFTPGTSQAYKDEINAHVAARRERLGLAERFTVNSRWADGGVNGDPISITYSLVPDGTALPGMIAKPAEPAGPSRMFIDFDQAFDGFREFWIALLAESFTGTRFDSWGSISGVTFTRVTGPPVDPDGPGPLPEANVDWDDGAPWGDNGPILGGGAEHGDIRIAAKFIDGIGGVFGYAFPPDDPMYPGEIVLDVDEYWEDPSFGFRRLSNIPSHLVGIALGLGLSCPADDTKIMEPIADEKDLLGPGFDDIRGVQVLYGDLYENNDVFDVQGLPFFPFDPVESLLGQEYFAGNLSIDQTSDEDLFLLTIPEELGETVDIDVRIEATPLGTFYFIGEAINGGCGGVPTVNINSGIAQNLRISLRDENGLSVTNYRDLDGDSVSADGLGYINIADAGDPEVIIAKIEAPGVYYVEISSSGGPDPLAPQIYELDVLVGNQIFSNGTPMDVPVVDMPPAGIGASYITNLPDLGLVPPEQETYTGLRAVFGQIDAMFPSMNHNTLVFPDANTPNTRIRGQQRVSWPGSLTSQPAVGDVSETADTWQAASISHATIAAAAGAGNPEGVFPSGYIGTAYESSILAGAVATRVVPSGFSMTRESLMYAIYSMVDPVFAAAAGIPSTATVISNPFGFAGDLRGDTYISQLYDAIVFQYGVTIVAGTGNVGAIDQTSQCGGSGQDVPGGAFRGARTVQAPATGYNVLSVGAVAKALPEETPSQPQFVNPRGDSLSIIPDFSGKGPIDSFDYTTQQLVPNARPGVDLVAPGTGYVLVAEDPQELDPPAPPCSYPGHRNAISITAPAVSAVFDADLDNPSNPGRYASTFGTSISAGVTAGAIALLQDAALAQDPPFSIAPEVMHAIVVASATPQLGWTNTQGPARPQDNRDGTESFITDEDTGTTVLNPVLFLVRSARSFDFAQGAGVLNLRDAFTILRGAHVDPLRAFFVPVVPGTETQNPTQTNPNVPTITDPPRELQDIAPSFGVSTQMAASVAPSVKDLPLSPLQIQVALRMANGDNPAEPKMVEHADFGDSKLDEVDGSKGATGTSFAPRPPFKLPPNAGGGFGGNPQAPAPTELQNKIIVGPIGWDHGQVGQRIMSLPAKEPQFPTAGPIRSGYIDYFIAFPYDGSLNLQTALSWMRTVRVAPPDFSNPDDPQIGEITSLEQENLDLEIIRCDAFGTILEDHVFLGTEDVEEGGVVVDGSQSEWNNTEFTSSVLPAGFYVIRVRWVASNYDLFRNEVDGSVKFGLAWITDAFGGLAIPGTTSSARALPASQPQASTGQRVIAMASAAMGSSVGDARFNPAFDADRDGKISIRDMMQVWRFWGGR